LGFVTATRPQRGRKPLLDEVRVVESALSLLDEGGLAAVSFRRIGQDLGVSHMTIYSYFDSKDALLEALVAATLNVPSVRPREGAPLAEALTVAMHDIYGALTERPAIAELLVTLPLNGTWINEVREALLDLLRDVGCGDARARDGISVLFNYLLGAVLIDARRSRGGSPQAYDQGLRYLVDGLCAELLAG